MDEHELFDTLSRFGFEERSDAERAVRATLAVLGERLTRDENELVASALPASLRPILRESRYDVDFDAAELFERVRKREQSSAGFSRERAESVLAALGRHLPEDTLVYLERHLPRDIAELLLPRAEGEPPPHGTAARPGRSLATGRPGSRTPLSEGAPPGAQSHSVVHEDNPHGETKLSSARGLTQERLGDSLSTAHPGPARTLAETHDTNEPK